VQADQVLVAIKGSSLTPGREAEARSPPLLSSLTFRAS
jgi:hypothetical protein